jgi:hypothetical protein
VALFIKLNSILPKVILDGKNRLVLKIATLIIIARVYFTVKFERSSKTRLNLVSSFNHIEVK